MTIQRPSLTRTIQILFLFFLVFAGLYFAKPFLVPVVFAGLFAMLFLPLCRWLEKYNIPRALAVILCLLVLLLIIAGIIALVTWGVTDLTSDLGNIEQKIKLIVKQVEQAITKTFGISQQQQQQVMDQQSKQAEGTIAGLGSTLMGFIVDFVLMLVYIFLFMYSRSHLKKFIIQLIPRRENANTEDAIANIEKVAQQYITGLGAMIGVLWVLYSIGFSIIGLQNPVFFAIICGLLEIVPFVGNLTGNALAILMAITQGGGVGMVVGIVGIYAFVQFFQTYVLEPLIVGSRVNINPLFTVMVLVVGELVWGIPGMVVAIPLLAIFKIICDHVDALKPYGFLIGTAREKKKKSRK